MNSHPLRVISFLLGLIAATQYTLAGERSDSCNHSLRTLGHVSTVLYSDGFLLRSSHIALSPTDRMRWHRLLSSANQFLNPSTVTRPIPPSVTFLVFSPPQREGILFAFLTSKGVSGKVKILQSFQFKPSQAKKMAEWIDQSQNLLSEQWNQSSHSYSTQMPREWTQDILQNLGHMPR